MNENNTLELPLNPDHYYGSSIAVENLKIGDVVFYKFPNTLLTDVEKTTIESFGKTEDGNKYLIHGQGITLVASQNTRVQCSTLL